MPPRRAGATVSREVRGEPARFRWWSVTAVRKWRGVGRTRVGVPRAARVFDERGDAQTTTERKLKAELMQQEAEAIFKTIRLLDLMTNPEPDRTGGCGWEVGT